MTCDSNLGCLPLARKLPAAVHSELVARLLRGENVGKIVRWLRRCWCGELSHLGDYGLRKLVVELRGWLEQNPQDRNASVAPTTTSSESSNGSAVQKLANRMTAGELLERAAKDAYDELEFACEQRKRGIAVDTSKPREALYTIARLARELGIEQDDAADEPIPSTRNANAPGSIDPFTDIDIREVLKPQEAEVLERVKKAPPSSIMLQTKAIDIATQLYDVEHEIKQLETGRAQQVARHAQEEPAPLPPSSPSEPSA